MTHTPEKFVLWFRVNYPSLNTDYNAPLIYRAATRASREERERLQHVNTALLESLKAIVEALERTGEGFVLTGEKLVMAALAAVADAERR